MASSTPWWDVNKYASFEVWSSDKYCCIAPVIPDNNRRCRVGINLSNALYYKKIAEALPRGPQRTEAIKDFIRELNCDFAHKAKLRINCGDVHSALAERYGRYLQAAETTMIKIESKPVIMPQVLPEIRTIAPVQTVSDPSQGLVPYEPRPFDVQTVRTEIQLAVDPKWQRVGQVYCASWPSMAGYVKIGYTGGSASERIARQAESCFPGMRLEAAFHFDFPEKIERLIHHQLLSHRKNMYLCQSCKAGHIEWFQIPTSDAVEVLSDWYRLTQKEPLYDSNRLLRSIWNLKISTVADNITAGELLDSLHVKSQTPTKSIIASTNASEPSITPEMTKLMAEHLAEMRLLREEMKSFEATSLSKGKLEQSQSTVLPQQPDVKLEPEDDIELSKRTKTAETVAATPVKNHLAKVSFPPTPPTTGPNPQLKPTLPNVPAVTFPSTPPTTVQKPRSWLTFSNDPTFTFGTPSWPLTPNTTSGNKPNTNVPFSFKRADQFHMSSILDTPSKTPLQTSTKPPPLPSWSDMVAAAPEFNVNFVKSTEVRGTKDASPATSSAEAHSDLPSGSSKSVITPGSVHEEQAITSSLGSPSSSPNETITNSTSNAALSLLNKLESINNDSEAADEIMVTAKQPQISEASSPTTPKPKEDISSSTLPGLNGPKSDAISMEDKPVISEVSPLLSLKHSQNENLDGKPLPKPSSTLASPKLPPIQKTEPEAINVVAEQTLTAGTSSRDLKPNPHDPLSVLHNAQSILSTTDADGWRAFIGSADSPSPAAAGHGAKNHRLSPRVIRRTRSKSPATVKSTSGGSVETSNLFPGLLSPAGNKSETENADSTPKSEIDKASSVFPSNNKSTQVEASEAATLPHSENKEQLPSSAAPSEPVEDTTSTDEPLDDSSEAEEDEMLSPAAITKLLPATPIDTAKEIEILDLPDVPTEEVGLKISTSGMPEVVPEVVPTVSVPSVSTVQIIEA